MCRPPPGPAGEDASREAEVADEDQPANCLVGASQKLTCFEKTDSFDGGSEVSTPGPKSYSGYVPVTPVSSLSYDNNAEDGPHPRFFPESRDENFIGENVLLHLYDLNDTLGHMNSVSVDTRHWWSPSRWSGGVGQRMELRNAGRFRDATDEQPVLLFPSDGLDGQDFAEEEGGRERNPLLEEEVVRQGLRHLGEELWAFLQRAL